jgi:hypothetical protein
MDLFLDTLTYGAHSTASDALWAGLPMVTMRGDAFPSRVGISLLHAVGLESALVAQNDEDFVNVSVELLTHPYRLNAIRRRLGRELLRRGGLFDAQMTAKVSLACLLLTGSVFLFASCLDFFLAEHHAGVMSNYIASLYPLSSIT